MITDFKSKPLNLLNLQTRLDDLMKLRNVHTFAKIAKDLKLSPNTVSA